MTRDIHPAKLHVARKPDEAAERAAQEAADWAYRQTMRNEMAEAHIAAQEKAREASNVAYEKAYEGALVPSPQPLIKRHMPDPKYENDAGRKLLLHAQSNLMAFPEGRPKAKVRKLSLAKNGPKE